MNGRPPKFFKGLPWKQCCVYCSNVGPGLPPAGRSIVFGTTNLAAKHPPVPKRPFVPIYRDSRVTFEMPDGNTVELKSYPPS